ncbi:WbqC family protein [Bizionia myxarmorum]|uniref:WbqC family protein n=1 Tax=Bizionia myxarmorum TaxID=291186 RepID=A0A5D0R5Z8_9FLAO|nr:WbqC family protein [Bizionia myxarmorum]TYB77060.1 WbqC family protein [Bizionia myxarmorum]
MQLLIHPTYFPNIAHFVAISQAETVTFEMADNFQKQTYRNRTYIYGANGKLLLNIPVVHTQKNRQQYADVLIHNEEKWQRNHWRSLESAYKTSPFFEYYEDDLKPLFEEPASNLLHYNIACFETVCDCLQLELDIKETATFEKNPMGSTDLRFLVQAKGEKAPEFEPYTQVFDDKHDYINNLSILDLLFNEGPNAVNYLQSQKAFW